VHIGMLKYINCTKTVVFKCFSNEPFVSVIDIFVPILSPFCPQWLHWGQKGTKLGTKIGDKNWGQKLGTEVIRVSYPGCLHIEVF